MLPVGPDPEPDLRVHEGYEWLYVLDGQLRLVLGEHDLVLPPAEAAEVLSLFGPRGERAHLRARSRA